MAYQSTFSPPDREENKLLRRYYFRLSWIMIALVLVFSGATRLVMTISAGIVGGGFTSEQITAGRILIRSIPEMSALYSYGFPIAADIAALGIGLIITKTDLRSKLRSPGLSGKDFLSAASLSFGTSTVAAFVNILLIFFIMAAIGKLSDFDPEKAVSGASSITENPLWLDVLIYFYICLLGPFLEELIFRGVLLEGLRKYGNLFGIIMSAVLFGLMHQNIVQFIPTVCVGIIWGYVAVKSGSLIPSILIHMLNNTMSALLLASVPNMSSINDISALLNMSIPMFIISGLLSLIRFACVIASIVIIVKYFSGRHGKLVDSNEYTSSRTWKYFFTSVPWLLTVAFLFTTTVTSITRLA